MERNFPSPAASSCDMQFQVSLLRLIYPGSAVSTHVAELEQMQEPVTSGTVRN